MITTDRSRDPLADVFDRFTAEASGEIVAPGAGTARLTAVHRRRRNGAVAVLAVAATAAIAGTVILPGQHGRGPARPSTPLPGHVDPNLTVIATAVIDGGAGAQSHGVGPQDVTIPDIPNGYYELTYDCVGTGTVNVTLSFTPHSGQTVATTNEGPQPCAAHPVDYQVPLHRLDIQVDGPGVLGITFGADAETAARAAMAYRLDWVARN